METQTLKDCLAFLEACSMSLSMLVQRLLLHCSQVHQILVVPLSSSTVPRSISSRPMSAYHCRNPAFRSTFGRKPRIGVSVWADLDVNEPWLNVSHEFATRGGLNHKSRMGFAWTLYFQNHRHCSITSNMSPQQNDIKSSPSPSRKLKEYWNFSHLPSWRLHSHTLLASPLPIRARHYHCLRPGFWRRCWHSGLRGDAQIAEEQHLPKKRYLSLIHWVGPTRMIKNATGTSMYVSTSSRISFRYIIL